MTYWQQKVVVVTGASQGFGKALAYELVKQGAQVVLVARDPARLEAAATELDPTGQRVTPLAADLTDDQAVVRIFQEIEQRHGKLDAVFNIAGASARGRIGDTTIDDFLTSFDLNVLATVRCVQAALPMLQRSRGHIVNMGSLASKSASKFIGPYATSKFALAGLNHQLRLELEDAGIHVLLVCPGPIAREDVGTRYTEQTAGLPETAQKPGAGVKVKAIDPHALAQRMLKACERRRKELVVPGKARILFAVSQLSAEWGDWLLKRFTSS